MFPDKVVKSDAAVCKDLLDSKGAFFPFDSRHDLSFERDVHSRSCPFGFNRSFKPLFIPEKQSHFVPNLSYVLICVETDKPSNQAYLRRFCGSPEPPVS